MSLAESTKNIVVAARYAEERKISEHLRAYGWSSMGSDWIYPHGCTQKDEYIARIGMKDGIVIELFQRDLLCGNWQVVRRQNTGNVFRRDILAVGYGLDKLIEELARRGVS